jgi:cytochrome c6
MFAPSHQNVKAAVAGAAVTAGVAVAPAFAGDVGAGEQVFNANCAACHAGGQNVIMPEKTLEKAALEQYLAGGRNEKAVITQVTNGKNAMPAFGGRLSDEDIANVASYVIATSEAGWD